MLSAATNHRLLHALPPAWRKRVRYGVWFFRISRWSNLVLLSAALYLAALFLLEPEAALLARLGSWRLLVAVTATACITAGGYIINDYFDVQIDRINRPGTLIVGRKVHRRKALLLHGMLTAAGVLLGLLASPKVAALQVLAAGCLYLYSAVLKRSPGWGNVLVAMLTSAGLLVPWLLFGQAKPMLWVYIAFCFLISLIREVVKDAEDMRGDATFGCRTLPIVYGLPRTRQLVYALLGLLSLAALALPAYLGSPVAVYNLMLVLPITFFALQLRVADTRLQFRSLSSLAKSMMALGVLGMLIA